MSFHLPLREGRREFASSAEKPLRDLTSPLPAFPTSQTGLRGFESGQVLSQRAF